MIKSLYINVNMQIGFHMEVMMNSQFVRIESITIENFKNVRKGVLDFENRRKKYRTSIVGLYGQNGAEIFFVREISPKQICRLY